MKQEVKITDKAGNVQQYDVSGSYSDDKPMTEMEYLEYMAKKAKSTNTIIYPDGSKGELNRAVVVLL